MARKKAVTRYFPVPDDVRAKYFTPLINQYRGDLANAKFTLLFREGRWSSKKRETWANIKLLSAETKAMIKEAYGKDTFDENKAPNFVLTINYEVWNNFGANDEARFALLHHELCHCDHDVDKHGNDKFSIIGHDFEEFTSIVHRYGNWSEDCRRMFDAMKKNGQQVLKFEKGSDAEKDSQELEAS